MTLNIKLSNQNLISYARTDDAIEALRRSAENGQTRLALELLVEVIDGIVEAVEDLMEKTTSIETPAEDLNAETIIDNEPQFELVNEVKQESVIKSKKTVKSDSDEQPKENAAE